MFRRITFFGAACLFVLSWGWDSFLPPAAMAQDDAAKGATLIDVDTLFAAVSDGARITYGSVSYDPYTGNTIVSDMRVVGPMEAETGFAVDRLAVRGVDVAALSDLIESEGTDWPETLVIEHVEMEAISFFGDPDGSGFEAGYLGTSPGDKERSVELQRSDITLASIQFDGITIAAPRTSEEGLPRMGADRISASGLAVDVTFLDNGQPLSMLFDVEELALAGWEGGNFSEAISSGLQFRMSGPASAFEAPEDEQAWKGDLSFEFEIGSYSIADVRLDRVLDYLVREEMPPSSKTDLLSLGLVTLQDMQLTMNKRPIFSLQRAVTDIRDFHWLIPTRIISTVENFVLDLDGTLRLVAEMDPTYTDDADGQAVIDALPLLADYNLAQLQTQSDLEWTWSPETGDMMLDLGYGLDAFATLRSRTASVFPNYTELTAVFDAEDPQAAFSQVFTEAFEFREIEMVLTDTGGLDATFNLIADLASFMSAKGDPTIQEINPNDLRLMAASAIGQQGAGLSSIFPPARGYLKSAITFIERGGVLTAAMRPSEPLSRDSLAMLGTETDEIAEVLGISVTHAAPAP